MSTKSIPTYIPEDKVLAYRKGKYSIISRKCLDKLLSKPGTIIITKPH